MGGFLKSDFIVQNYYLHGDACEWNDLTINNECEDYVNKCVVIYGNLCKGAPYSAKQQDTEPLSLEPAATAPVLASPPIAATGPTAAVTASTASGLTKPSAAPAPSAAAAATISTHIFYHLLLKIKG
jgi:hypothetical protein